MPTLTIPTKINVSPIFVLKFNLFRAFILPLLVFKMIIVTNTKSTLESFCEKVCQPFDYIYIMKNNQQI